MVLLRMATCSTVPVLQKWIACRLCIASTPWTCRVEVVSISLGVPIEGVAVNGHVAIEAAAADGPDCLPEDQALAAVLTELVAQDPDGVDRRQRVVVEDHALFVVIEEAVVLDGDVLLSDARTRRVHYTRTAGTGFRRCRMTAVDASCVIGDAEADTTLAVHWYS
jgi:hypothetical protein